MTDLLSSSQFWLLISIGFYALGVEIQKKTGSPVCNPLLIASILVGALLIATGTPYQTYEESGKLISFFLTPATVALAIPIYRKLDVLLKNLLPILLGAFVGSMVSIGSVLLFSHLFGLSESTTLSLVPKSVTTPIAVAVAEMLGGVTSITAIAVVVTGIIGAINHMEGAHSGSAYRKGFYTVPEFIERVRIHAYEGGTSMSGNMAAVPGEAIGANYMPQRGFLPSEGLCRIEYACCHGGYWGVTARMIHIGEDMDPRVRSACADNLSLKMLALDMLRPGVACSDIHGAVVKEAAKRGIPLSSASGIGHGVGRGEIEGPYLAADDPTVLCENMVIALDVATLGPEGELLRSIDIFADGRTRNIPDLYDGAIEITPIPTVEELNAHVWGEEFHACIIEQAEFEAIWETHTYDGALK